MTSEFVAVLAPLWRIKQQRPRSTLHQVTMARRDAVLYKMRQVLVHSRARDRCHALLRSREESATCQSSRKQWKEKGAVCASPNLTRSFCLRRDVDKSQVDRAIDDAAQAQLTIKQTNRPPAQHQ